MFDAMRMMRVHFLFKGRWRLCMAIAAALGVSCGLWWSSSGAQASLNQNIHNTLHNAEVRFDRDAAMAESRGAIGQTVQNYRFTDSNGHAISLDDFIGRPVLVNLVYTSCSHTCPMIVESLANALAAARAGGVGEQLIVLTIGFDVGVDTPERMRVYRRERGITSSDWYFLSADRQTIDALASDVGFAFASTPYGYDHIAQVSLIDAERRVFRQIYGGSFAPPVLVEPVKELLFGENAGLTGVEGLANQLRLFCTIYDASSGRYRFDYSLLISIFVGGGCLAAIAVFLIRGFVRASRHTGR